MTISREGIDISNRFFDAIERLRRDHKMRGLKTFCDRNELNRWNMITIKRDPATHVLKPEYIYLLSKQYGVSVVWLMMGEGEFYI